MSSCLRANNWVRFVILNPKGSTNLLAVQRSGQFTLASWFNRMRAPPEVSCNHKGIDPVALPPSTLVAASVELTVMQPANGDGEPVADFPAHRPLFGKLEVVGIRRDAPADEARLGGHKPQMVAIALPYRFADDGNYV
jgi:hypothetical protein